MLLNGVALCLKRGLYVQFFREICPRNKRIPFSWLNILPLAGELLNRGNNLIGGISILLSDQK
jgi:hypothetical protein